MSRAAAWASAPPHPALRELASRLGEDDELLAGHEVGGQVYLVHDAVTAAGVTIQAFNAAHLRMIAASRKKTDEHDAYWIAKALQTGMTPHPVRTFLGEQVDAALAQPEAIEQFGVGPVGVFRGSRRPSG